MKNYAVFIGVAALAATLYFAKPTLTETAETFYYSSASSVSERVSEREYGFFPRNINYLPVKGESAFIPGECDVNAVLDKYSAKPLKITETNGVTDYYCYSTLLGGGIRLYGKTVNFHLSVCNYGYSVAAPLNFGGY